MSAGKSADASADALCIIKTGYSPESMLKINTAEVANTGTELSIIVYLTFSEFYFHLLSLDHILILFDNFEVSIVDNRRERWRAFKCKDNDRYYCRR